MSGLMDFEIIGIATTSNPLSFNTLLLSFTKPASGLKCCADSSATTLSKDPLANGIIVDVQFTRSMLVFACESELHCLAIRSLAKRSWLEFMLEQAILR